MKYLILFGVLALLASGQLYSVSVCACKDLKVETDCKASTKNKCTWSGTACVDYQSPTDSGDTSSKSLYCSQFQETDCAKKTGCAWVEKACTHFTGCTAFKLDTFDACQAISKDCITDGVHCVEINFCNTYLTETSCTGSPKDRYLCYWNADGKNCQNADRCEYLPKSYKTDKECRDAIKTCTVNSTLQGCVTSGSTCNQQTIKEQCVYDLNKSKQCNWNEEWTTDTNKCRDYTCEEAPKSYSTYKQCNDYGKLNLITTLKCTAKEGGGCQNINNCEDNKIKAACEYNSSGAKCTWDEKKFCILLNCDAAPTTLTTNDQCKDFVKTFTDYNCITKSGGGCVSNGYCNAANIKDACKLNASGKTCYWDDITTPNACKEFTCDNLPKAYKTAKDCSDKIFTCTLAVSGAGCIQKTCSNAPTDTADCEAYYPSNNCVPKKEGGCQPLGDCSTILQASCETKKNKSGQSCFWDGSACKELICDNLVGSTYNDHTACNQKIPTCTVKTGGNGCEDWKCENSFKDDNCTKDKCTWKGGKCFKKECSLAPISYNTHKQCNEYLDSCTSSLEKTPVGGCSLIPLKCEGILNEEACNLKKTTDGNNKVVYVKCGWDGTKCIDQGCTTLSKTLTTTADCNSAGEALDNSVPNCVSNNPDSANEIKGCIVLPSSCKDRKTQDNCSKRYGNTGAFCVWVPSEAGAGNCQDRACTTAHLDGSTDEVKTINNDNCRSYLDTCIANNDNTQCMNKPTACTNITVQGNCEDNTKSNNGHCVWNGSCKDKTCANLPYTTHSNCYAASKIDKTCTVNDDKSGCIPLKTNCADYKGNSEQCVITSSGKKCFYSGTCRDLTCGDINRTNSFNSHSKCNAELDTCTVVPAVGNQCQSKATKCSDYAIAGNCVETVNGTKCKWDGKICQVESDFDCTLIQLQTYSNDNCKAVYYKCKANKDSTPDGCAKRSCADYAATVGDKADDEECSAFDNTCTSTTNTNTPCQTIQDNCSSYNDNEKTCTVAKQGKCKWQANVKCFLATAPCSSFTGANDTECGYYGFCKKSSSSTTCESKKCSDTKVAEAGTAITPDECAAVDASCKSTDSTIINEDGCYALSDNCEDYKYIGSCKTKLSGKKCFWNGSACKNVANTTCSLITSQADFTKAKCQEYDTSCTVNRAGTACLQIESNCASYTDLGNCVERTLGLCVQSQKTNSGATCKNPVASTVCSQIYFAETTYTDEKCSSLNVLCKAKSDKSACEDKTCENATTKTSFKSCNEWLTSCTWNKKTDGTAACVAINNNCADQKTEATCFQAKDGECTFVDGKCKVLDCLDKITDADTNDKCIAYSSTCTLANPGGCQGFTTNCSDYKQRRQCNKTSTNKDCFWNTNTKTCVDFSCDKIEQSSTYSSHPSCYSLANDNSKTLKCTVRANADNTATSTGCLALNSCGSYKIKEQCVVDSSIKPCEWVVTDSSSTCVSKTCTTADNTYNTHDNCKSYYQPDNTKISCTVKAVKAEIASDPAVVGGGCIPLAACDTYLSEVNCIINDQQAECAWNGTQCAIKSCSTAQSTVTDHAGCQVYFSKKCTVAETLKGCIDLPVNCEDLSKQEQCYINKAGDKCYWTGEKCITPSCDNTPQSFIDGNKCEEYNKLCTQDNTTPCKSLVCEDYSLTTDDACKGKIPTCTTDGTKCVLRKLCNQALHKNGCVTDLQGGKCQWNSDKNQCEIMTCSTAPASEYTTDDLCFNYYQSGKCMLKADAGGCTDRTICTQMKTESACKSNNGDIQKVKCSWDNGQCRYQNCTDFSGSTHADCQTKYVAGQCTVGAGGKCAAIQDCEKTTIQAACVQDLSGPCLWISGACYSYKKCENRTWGKDDLCKAISKNCTTDGTKCVPITSCEQTNTTGGCKTGYDGQCILTKGTTGKLCKKKDKGCVDAAFTTWSECHDDVNSTCSTDGQTCIELQECKDYKFEEACKNSLSKTPVSKTLTGKCNWDSAAQSCHDEKCSELVNNTTSNSGCYSQLSQCTSDGTKCLDRTSCDKYQVVEGPCNASFDTNNNPCFFEAASTANNNTAKCRVKTCTDLKVAECSSGSAGALQCVSDGTACVVKAACSSYKTKTSCNAGGTDGVCVFTATATGSTAGTCATMTSCTQAKSDKDACKSFPTKCAWTDQVAATGTTAAQASKCEVHTCATYQSSFSRCENIKSFDDKLQTICQVVQNKCSEVDPKTLTAETCFVTSGYTYTWNTGTVGCQACSTVTPTPGNNSTNPNNTGNDTNTDDSGYILGFAAAVIYTML